MYKVGNKKLFWYLFVIASGVLLSGCQINNIYSNPDSGFTFEYPSHWELVEESEEKVEFLSKDEGDAAISIMETDEIAAPTAKESLAILLNQLLEEPLAEGSNIHISEVEHPQYDVMMAHIMTYSTIPANFPYDYYLVVAQTTNRMAVFRTAGDGNEPAIAAQIIIDSFEFLP